MLQRANAKAKARHDKNHIPHSFQIQDQVWLPIKKERFTSPYRNLKPLEYGHTLSLNILEKMISS